MKDLKNRYSAPSLKGVDQTLNKDSGHVELVSTSPNNLDQTLKRVVQTGDMTNEGSSDLIYPLKASEPPLKARMALLARDHFPVHI